MKTREEKLAFIKKVKEGGITENELFLMTLDLGKCTPTELNWMLSVARKSKAKRLTLDVITEEHMPAFEEFKRNYNERNSKNKIR